MAAEPVEGTPVQRGGFITFEGGEGAGKSTQIRRLARRLGEPRNGAAPEVVVTREPGGSPGAELLRSLLVQGDSERWSATAETLILYAARADHLERLIRPALERGAWLLSDRFADSTRAYQGAGGGASAALIAALDQAVVGADGPDLTLILDVPAELGLARAVARAGPDMRFESKPTHFHERLRGAYLAIAAAEPDRCRLIDGAADPEAVAAEVWSAVRARFELAA